MQQINSIHKYFIGFIIPKENGTKVEKISIKYNSHNNSIVFHHFSDTPPLLFNSIEQMVEELKRITPEQIEEAEKKYGGKLLGYTFERIEQHEEYSCKIIFRYLEVSFVKFSEENNDSAK